MQRRLLPGCFVELGESPIRRRTRRVPLPQQRKGDVREDFCGAEDDPVAVTPMHHHMAVLRRAVALTDGPAGVAIQPTAPRALLDRAHHAAHFQIPSETPATIDISTIYRQLGGGGRGLIEVGTACALAFAERSNMLNVNLTFFSFLTYFLGEIEMMIKDLEISKELTGEELSAVRGGGVSQSQQAVGAIYSGYQMGNNGDSFASPITNVGVVVSPVTQTAYGTHIGDDFNGNYNTKLAAFPYFYYPY